MHFNEVYQNRLVKVALWVYCIIAVLTGNYLIGTEIIPISPQTMFTGIHKDIRYYRVKVTPVGADACWIDLCDSDTKVVLMPPKLFKEIWSIGSGRIDVEHLFVEHLKTIPDANRKWRVDFEEVILDSTQITLDKPPREQGVPVRGRRLL